jgi:hypothetical protein
MKRPYAPLAISLVVLGLSATGANASAVRHCAYDNTRVSNSGGRGQMRARPKTP